MTSLDKKTLARVSAHMLRKNETLAVAESVTSGLIMHALSDAENATLFFQGGIVAYNLGQKVRHLAVEPIFGEATNCVSEQVTRQMAYEVARAFCAHWGIAITGYAVPVPALKIKTCFAIYSFYYNGYEVATNRVDTNLKTQAATQKFFVTNVLKEFAKQIE